jgi:hypothetical protein
MDFEGAISKVKDIFKNVNATKSQDAVVNKALFTALNSVYETALETTDSILLATSNLSVLEEVCTSKFLTLGKSLQGLLISIYSIVISKAPGYVTRNIILNMMNSCQNKSIPTGSRECLVLIIGAVVEKRSFDCGSLLTDVFQCLSKIIKSGELKFVALKSLVQLVNGAQSRIEDIHPEILKLISKFITDKSVDVKMQISYALSSICRFTTGQSTITPESILAIAIKGVEDENIYVQEAFTITCASIFCELYSSYLEQQEKNKIGIARGTNQDHTSPSQSKKKSSSSSSAIERITKLNIAPTQKKMIDDYQFRSIINHLLKNITKSTSSTLRNAHIAILGHFVKGCLHTVNAADFQWVIVTIVGIFHDSAILALSAEDIAYCRTRISHLFRNSIASNMSESQLISLSPASVLISYIASLDVRTDHELQVALVSLNHVVCLLGEMAVTIVDEVQAVVTGQLRHASFGVRSASAYVLASLAISVPGIAAALLRTSLTNASAQSRQLSGVEMDPHSNLKSSSQDDTGDSDQESYGGVGRRGKSPKEIERLQRMYFFHGHTLVISLFLKNVGKLPTGLPNSLILEIFDFGLELLRLDSLSAPSHLRSITCSIVRAGSLIVSSCLNMGYQLSKTRIIPMLECCDALFKQVHASSANVNTLSTQSSGNGVGLSGDDLLYELMGVEAALVCVSTLLWSCPDALEFEVGCLALVVDGLEMAFRAVKGKYQPKFRTHFRFRTLHAILLECFAWLPPGSFPNTCQQLFVEALRVFRDCVSNAYETSYLSELNGLEEYAILGMYNGNAMVSQVSTSSISSTVTGTASTAGSRLSSFSYVTPDIPLTEETLMLRLENYALALQKKESEAFLSTFAKDSEQTDSLRSQFLMGIEWRQPVAPCAHLDTRTVDAAITVIGVLFILQNSEYQDKAVQLNSQALMQLSKYVCHVSP